MYIFIVGLNYCGAFQKSSVVSDAEIRCIHELLSLKIFLILDKLSWVFGCLWGRDSIVYSSVCLHVSRHCVCSSCRSVSSSESSWQTHHWTPGAVPGSRRGKLIFILLINWTSQDFLCFFVLLTLLYESYVFENGKKGTIGRSVPFPTDHKQNKKPEELLHCLFRE